MFNDISTGFVNGAPHREEGFGPGRSGRAGHGAIGAAGAGVDRPECVPGIVHQPNRVDFIPAGDAGRIEVDFHAGCFEIRSDWNAGYAARCSDGCWIGSLPNGDLSACIVEDRDSFKRAGVVGFVHVDLGGNDGLLIIENEPFLLRIGAGRGPGGDDVAGAGRIGRADRLEHRPVGDVAS